MSRNLGYTRKFIILRKDYSTMVHLNPKGHGKLEVKGLKALLTLNLENAEANNYYDVLLVGHKNVYDLGKIFVEENYKGSNEFLIGIKNLESEGFSLDRINGVLITSGKDVLLGGYFKDSDNSIENYLNSLKQMEAAEELGEEVIEEAEEEFIEAVEETLYGIIEEEEIRPELEEQVLEEQVLEEVLEECEDIFEVFKPEEIEYEEVQSAEIIEEPVEDEPLVWEELFEPIDEDSQQVITDPTIEEVFISALEDLFNEAENGTIDKSIEEESKAIVEELDYDQFQNNNKIIQRNQTTGYILKILRYFPYIDPFKVNLKGYNWWKINTEDPNEEIGFLPYFSYVTGGNHKYPIIENAITANELMRRHKHYLFGLYNFNDEVKFYVYGIPGNFATEDHPQKGLTGFNTWYEDKNDNGYWLLYIDPLTGRVIYPINPMIPVD